MDTGNAKILLPQFLKMLTSNTIPMPKAMTIAGKVYKEHNTRETLAQLADAKLKDLGVDSPEDRKLILTALRKSGYGNKAEVKGKKVPITPEASGSQSPSPKKRKVSTSSSAHPIPIKTKTTPPKRKRRRTDGSNEFLPDGPSDDDEEQGDWDFSEVLDEEALKLKTAVINRAPVMMAWATLVAEKMHFSRAEALSIASAYTEMNAVTKGVSLGIYRRDEERGREASEHGSQPYVEIIGRKPLYRTHTNQWRALSNGKPVPPSSAFKYISQSFRQATPFIIGALKVLADSYTPKELNERAWSLYADFRPEVNEWGKRSEIRCSVILDLRKKGSRPSQNGLGKEETPTIGYESSEGAGADEESRSKKARTLTLEEYEAALDADTTFNDVDLDLAFDPPESSAKT